MKYNWTGFKGIIAALITPLKNDGQINESTLREIVEYLIQTGIRAFYVNGTTGEAFLMSAEERMKNIEIVMSQTKSRIPVINQIGSHNIDDTIRLAQHSENCEVEAISAITPFYYKYDIIEIADYYNTIMHSCTLPLFIYTVPSFSGHTLEYDFINDIAKNKQLVGIKYSSENLYDMLKLKDIKTSNGNLLVMSGIDGMFLGALGSGVKTFVGSFYGVMPEIYIDIFDHYLNCRHEAAEKTFVVANEIIRTVLKYPVISALKMVLHWKGFDTGICKKPLRQLSIEEEINLKKQLCYIEEENKTGLRFFKEIDKAII